MLHNWMIRSQHFEGGLLKLADGDTTLPQNIWIWSPFNAMSYHRTESTLSTDVSTY